VLHQALLLLLLVMQKQRVAIKQRQQQRQQQQQGRGRQLVGVRAVWQTVPAVLLVGVMFR
jgi:hypothetical protein